MGIISYRIVKEKYVDTAFDGEGARLYGGRWNSKGISAIYTSDSLALCSLEIFVHLPSYTLLTNYVYMTVAFDSKLVTEVPIISGWDERPISKTSQKIGDKWVKESRSSILKVPSVLMPDGCNYLINIKHIDFNQIKIGKPQPLTFDPRFKK